MALQELIDHIRDHFGNLSGLPNVNQADPVSNDSLNSPQIDRAPRPVWLPDPGSIRPNYEPNWWVIEAEVPPPNPPSGLGQWGVDVLAFYLPFHFYRDGWGIYILASGVIYLACVLKGASRNRTRKTFDELAGWRYAHLRPGDERFLLVAQQVLWEHEAFHFASELAASRAELIAKAPVYEPYFSNRSATAHEEALANAQAISCGVKTQPKTLHNHLHSWMKGQGVGYCDFDKWLSSRTFFEGMSRAGNSMINCIPPPQTSPAVGEFLFRGSRTFKIPTKLVNDVTRGGAGLLRPLPKAFGLQVWTHSNDHRPPHIHIELPPGKPLSRYRWPQLTPLKGDPWLPRAGKKALRRYVEVHGGEIKIQIERVYGAA